MPENTENPEQPDGRHSLDAATDEKREQQAEKPSCPVCGMELGESYACGNGCDLELLYPWA